MVGRAAAHVAIVLALGAAAVGVVFLSGAACGLYTPVCNDDNTVRVAFDRAPQLAWGQEVRLAGHKVGEVKSVEEYGGHAVVTLKITEPEAWPLRQGTVARARFGSTTSYAWRYLDLLPGPPGAPAMRNRAVLSRVDSRSAFEYDDAFRIFRGRTRNDLREMIRGLGDTVGRRGPALGRGFRDAPGGLDETANLVHELGANEPALQTLVASGDRTLTALAARDPQLRELVGHAAGTFDEFAAHARDQQLALDRVPTTFRTTTATLSRLDRSLILLDGLVQDLRPGASELRSLASPLRSSLAELRNVAPLAADALGRGTQAAPPLGRLLRVGTSELPRLGSDLRQLQPMVSCLRPYGPEIAGTLSVWTSFGMNYDRFGHYVHGVPLQQNAILQPGTQLNSAQAVAASQGRLLYAMPRPPGLNATQGIGQGTPFFQPQCGAGPDSLDPTKDPEGAGRNP